MKKTQFPIFALLMVASFSSCSLPYRDVSPLTPENATYNFADNRDYRQISVSTSVIEHGAYSLINYDPAYCKRGYLEIRDENTGKRGIFSLLKNQVMLPLTYDHFAYIDSASNGTYIQAFTSPTIYDIFDYRGNKIKEGLSSNKTLSIKATTEILRYSRKHLIETISYDGTTETNEVFQDGSRVPFIAPCDLLWVDDTGYIPGTSELSDLAMEGCVGTVEHDRTFTVKKGNETLCSFSIPQAFSSIFMWKCFFYQYGEQTTGNDYDYLYQGNRYVLRTKRIELATGKIDTIPCNLLILGIGPVYSAEGKVRYAVARGTHFNNHEFDDKVGLYVIDNNAHEYWNANEDPCYDPDAYKVDWNAYYSPYFGTFIGQTLEPSFALHRWELGKINYTTRVISTVKESGYGITSFTGEELIKPTYDSISFAQDGSKIALGTSQNVFYTLDYDSKTATPHSFEKDEWGTDLGNGYLRCHSLGMVDDHSYVTTYYRDYHWNKIDYYSWASFLDTYELSTFFDDAQIDAFYPYHRYDFFTYHVFQKTGSKT